MNILSIETSCDDTCLALVKAAGKKLPYFKILSNIVSSQVKIHKKYGGVYPALAKREHQRNLPIALNKAIKETGFAISNFQFPIFKQIQNSKIKNIDLIAVTIGPGLEPCLWAGVNFANDLSKKLKVPIVPINHIEAHIAANFIHSDFQFSISNSQKFFPAICLVISGGHTQLILMRDFGKYKILGETRDDAAGECFDKTARILGLEYPGGPAIAANAQKNRGRASVKLPRPMIYQKNYDFSFSGLKTAVLYKVKSEKRKAKSEKYIQAMAAEIQQAIIDVLIHKTLKAVKEQKVKTIILGGGVTANKELRKQFKSVCLKSGLKLLLPSKNLSTDNALMVAVTGYFQWLKRKNKFSSSTEMKNWQKITANANLRISESL